MINQRNSLFGGNSKCKKTFQERKRKERKEKEKLNTDNFPPPSISMWYYLWKDRFHFLKDSN